MIIMYSVEVSVYTKGKGLSKADDVIENTETLYSGGVNK